MSTIVKITIKRWVNPCIEVGGRGEGTPGGRARRLSDDRQLQREARVQAGDAHYVVDGDLVTLSIFGHHKRTI